MITKFVWDPINFSFSQGRGKSGARVQIAPSILRFCPKWYKIPIFLPVLLTKVWFCTVNFEPWCDEAPIIMAKIHFSIRIQIESAF